MTQPAEQRYEQPVRVARSTTYWSRIDGDILVLPVTYEEYPPVGGEDSDSAFRARKRTAALANRDAYRAGLKSVSIVRGFDAIDGFPVDPRPFAVREGQQVAFPSKSAPGGTRLGTALQVSETRVLVLYKFNNGRQAAPKWVTKRLVEPART
jgi:hypothetical protein